MSQLSLDSHNSGLPVQAPLSKEAQEWKARSTWPYTRYKDTTDRDLVVYKSIHLPALKRLETGEKVNHVVGALLALGLPFAFAYLPAWAPWTIGIPTLLIQMVVAVNLKQKIEQNKSWYTALQLGRQMMKNPKDHCIQELHPLGIWDLPAVDPRMKSDVLMEKELQRHHPEPPLHLKELVRSTGIAVSPYLRLQAQRQLAHAGDRARVWSEIEKEVEKAKTELRKGNVDGYREKMDRIQHHALAYLEDKAPLDLGLFSPLSDEDQVRALVDHHKYLNHLVEGLVNLHKKGQSVWQPTFYQEQMETFNQSKDRIDRELSKYRALLKSRAISADEWIQQAQEIDTLQLRPALDALIDQTLHLQRSIQKEIDAHPVYQIQDLRKKLNEWEQSILPESALTALQAWIQAHPEQTETGIREVIPQLAESQQPITAWLEKNSLFVTHSVQDIYQRNALMFNSLQDVKRRASGISPQFTREIGVPNLEEYQEALRLAGALQQFRDEEMPRLGAVMRANRTPEQSRIKRFWQIMTNRLPALPFEAITIPGADQGTALGRNRRVEQKTIEAFLQSIDQDMRKTYITLHQGVQIVAYLVIMIVLAVFHSNFWVTWSMSAVMLGMQGISYFSERRLRRMDQQKQAYQLQLSLRDYPDLTRIPGSCPVLEDLQRVQMKYGLSGVTRTWARVLAEGEEEVFSRHWRTTAIEASAEARPPLERRLLELESAKARGENNLEQQAEIKRLNRVLFPKPPKDKKAPSQLNRSHNAENQAIKLRQQIEEQVDQIAEHKQLLKEQIADYQQGQRELAVLQGKTQGVDRAALGSRRGVIFALLSQISKPTDLPLEEPSEDDKPTFTQLVTRLEQATTAIQANQDIDEATLQGVLDALNQSHPKLVNGYVSGLQLEAAKISQQINEFDRLGKQARMTQQSLDALPSQELQAQAQFVGEQLRKFEGDLIATQNHLNNTSILLNRADKTTEHTRVTQLLDLQHALSSRLEYIQKMIAAGQAYLKSIKQIASKPPEEMLDAVSGALQTYLDQMQTCLKGVHRFEASRRMVWVLEKQLATTIDPEIEKKRYALIEHVIAEGDPRIKKDLQANLDQWTEFLRVQKETLADALAQALAIPDKNLALQSYKEARRQWDETLDKAYQNQLEEINKMDEGRLKGIYMHQLTLIRSLLDQECALSKVKEDQLCPEWRLAYLQMTQRSPRSRLTHAPSFIVDLPEEDMKGLDPLS